MNQVEEALMVDLSTSIHIMNKGDSIKAELTEITIAVQAISNFGIGGTIRMYNQQHRGRDAKHSGQKATEVTRSDLDKWKSNVLKNLEKALGEKADDCITFCTSPPESPFLFLYVDPCHTVVTNSYNLKIPTDTSVIDVNDLNKVIDILTRSEAPKELPYFDYDEYLPSTTWNADVEDDEMDRGDFSRKHLISSLNEFKIGDVLPWPETAVLQYKCIEDGDGLPDRIKRQTSKYVGAFANHAGGVIIFGVDDKENKVTGQTIANQNEKDKIVHAVERCVHAKCWRTKEYESDNLMIWIPTEPVKEKHWDILFQSLEDGDPEHAKKNLVLIYIKPFCGGVFYKFPEAFTLEEIPVHQDITHKITQMTPDLWLKTILRKCIPVPGVMADELTGKFTELDVSPCSVQRIFAMKDCVEHVQARLFKTAIGLNIYPSTIEAMVPEKERVMVQSIIRTLKEHYKSNEGFLLCSPCLSVDLGHHRPHDARQITCDFFVCSESEPPFLITLTQRGNTTAAKAYSKNTSRHLSLCLKGLGAKRFQFFQCVVTDPDSLSVALTEFHNEMLKRAYDPIIKIDKLKLNNIIKALALALASFHLDSVVYDHMGLEVMNLLTYDQMLALQLCKANRFIFVEGGPGTGKTVVGLERIKRLRLDGVPSHEILYVAATCALTTYVRNLQFPASSPLKGEPLCKVTDTSWVPWQNLKKVKHIVIDEIQNCTPAAILYSNQDNGGGPSEAPAITLLDVARYCIFNTGAFMLQCAFSQLEIPVVQNFACMEQFVRPSQDEYVPTPAWFNEVSSTLDNNKENKETTLLVLGDQGQQLFRRSPDMDVCIKYIQENHGAKITLRQSVRMSTEIQKFLGIFSIHTTAHDFTGCKPVQYVSQLVDLPSHLAKLLRQYIAIGYSPSDIAIINCWDDYSTLTRSKMGKLSMHSNFVNLVKFIHSVKNWLQHDLEVLALSLPQTSDCGPVTAFLVFICLYCKAFVYYCLFSTEHFNAVTNNMQNIEDKYIRPLSRFARCVGGMEIPCEKDKWDMPSSSSCITSSEEDGTNCEDVLNLFKEKWQLLCHRAECICRIIFQDDSDDWHNYASAIRRSPGISIKDYEVMAVLTHVIDCMYLSEVVSIHEHISLEEWKPSIAVTWTSVLDFCGLEKPVVIGIQRGKQTKASGKELAGNDSMNLALGSRARSRLDIIECTFSNDDNYECLSADFSALHSS